MRLERLTGPLGRQAFLDKEGPVEIEDFPQRRQAWQEGKKGKGKNAKGAKGKKKSKKCTSPALRRLDVLHAASREEWPSGGEEMMDPASDDAKAEPAKSKAKAKAKPAAKSKAKAKAKPAAKSKPAKGAGKPKAKAKKHNKEDEQPETASKRRRKAKGDEPGETEFMSLEDAMWWYFEISRPSVLKDQMLAFAQKHRNSELNTAFKKHCEERALRALECWPEHLLGPACLCGGLQGRWQGPRLLLHPWNDGQLALGGLHGHYLEGRGVLRLLRRLPPQ